MRERQIKPADKAKQSPPALLLLIRLIAAALVEHERGEEHKVKK